MWLSDLSELYQKFYSVFTFEVFGQNSLGEGVELIFWYENTKTFYGRYTRVVLYSCGNLLKRCWFKRTILPNRIFEKSKFEKNWISKIYSGRTKFDRNLLISTSANRKKKWNVASPPGIPQVRYPQNRCFSAKSSLTTGLAKTLAFSCFLRYREKIYGVPSLRSDNSRLKGLTDKCYFKVP